MRGAIQRAGAPPKGVSVAVRGQIPPLEETIGGLRTGLLLSVGVMFLLLAATACSPGGQPAASDTYLPPAVTTTADSPSAAASATDSPLPPVTPVTPAQAPSKDKGTTQKDTTKVRVPIPTADGLELDGALMVATPEIRVEVASSDESADKVSKETSFRIAVERPARSTAFPGAEAISE